jgi:TetR/AcrR family transcriptional regulator, cholesterol catabolism regulator
VVATGSDVRVRKGERTRRRILDAAAALYARHGIAAVSMNDVAAEVGMQAGSIYFHFPSKATLAAEVLDRGLAEGLAFVRSAVDEHDAAGGAPVRRLAVAIIAHLAALRQVSDYASVIAQAVAARGIGDGAAAPELERRYARYWLDLLRDQQRSGGLSPDVDLRIVRELLFGAMNSPALRDRDPREVARTLVTLIGVGS